MFERVGSTVHTPPLFSHPPPTPPDGPSGGARRRRDGGEGGHVVILGRCRQLLRAAPRGVAGAMMDHEGPRSRSRHRSRSRLRQELLDGSQVGRQSPLDLLSATHTVVTGWIISLHSPPSPLTPLSSAQGVVRLLTRGSADRPSSSRTSVDGPTHSAEGGGGGSSQALSPTSRSLVVNTADLPSAAPTGGSTGGGTGGGTCGPTGRGPLSPALVHLTSSGSIPLHLMSSFHTLAIGEHPEGVSRPSGHAFPTTRFTPRSCHLPSSSMTLPSTISGRSSRAAQGRVKGAPRNGTRCGRFSHTFGL